MLIGGFQPFSLSDFPGRSAAIVFTQGCNYCCPYCHNRPLWPEVAIEPTHTDTTVLDFLRGRINKLGGVVITGGEPSLQSDLLEFVLQVKQMGFSVKLDTNGSRPDVISSLLSEGLIDYIAMDVKAPAEKYTSLCGLPVNTGNILKSISIIASGKVPHHFRTTWFKPLLTEDDLADIQKMLPVTSRFMVQKYRNPSS